MIHVVTGTSIRENQLINFGFILQALGWEKGFSLLSFPYGYVKFKEGAWGIWVGARGRRILAAENVRHIEEVFPCLPPSVLLMSRETADRFVPIAREHGVAVEVHHTGRELSTDGL